MYGKITQEFSEIEITRGANAEAGTLGAVDPLIDGAFNPFKSTSQRRSASLCTAGLDGQIDLR